MADDLIAAIPKNSREELRVSLTEFKGHRLVDLRLYVAGDDGPIPTRKGLTIRPDLLPAIVTALMGAEAAISVAGDA